MKVPNRFPKDFMWGVATSSYQIEGAAQVDGKGPSIWDTFTHIGGNILNDDHGDVACDHYHLWRDDIQLMKELRVNSYRFSIAWARIFPMGDGRDSNKPGLDFYSRLVDGLLEAGIEPFITLYHWDLPLALQDRGGWPSREIVPAFVHYADTVSRVLGDRVKNWITHNEPLVVSSHGYLDGSHAPGHKDWNEALAAAHHLLLSHGQAVPVIQSNSKNSRIGITLNLIPVTPASPSAEDAALAHRLDGEMNRLYLDPIFHGRYPDDILDFYPDHKNGIIEDLSFIHAADMEDIHVPIDFLGVNYYSRAIARNEIVPEDQRSKVLVERGPETDIGWEIHADSLRQLLIRLKKDYPVPAYYITENGAAYHTAPNGSDRIRDDLRIAYLDSHLAACQQAISEGVPLKGYFAWTLMDNFEWAHGYYQKFGLVWVEPESLQRICKDSFFWYRNFITEHSKHNTEFTSHVV